MKKFIFRLSILLILILGMIYYLARNYGTLEKTLNVTLSQSLRFLVLAFVFSVLAYIFKAMMNREVFNRMGIKRGLSEMAFLQMSALAVNVVVPSAGLSVGLMFAEDANKRGESKAAAITAVIVSLLLDYIAIAIFLLIAIGYLTSVGSLSWPVVIPALLFLALAIGLFVLIWLSGKNQSLLRRLLNRVKKLINLVLVKFGRKKVGVGNGIDQFIVELENAYHVIRTDRGSLYRAMGYILISHLMYLAVLYVLFISVGITPLYRVLISGYAIGLMLIVISPTPSGVGIVEGSMAIAYASMGIAGAAAATVTLVFRGFSFWLPLLIGFVAIQRRHLMDFVSSKTEEAARS